MGPGATKLGELQASATGSWRGYKVNGTYVTVKAKGDPCYLPPLYHQLRLKASITPWGMLTCNLSPRNQDTWDNSFRVTAASHLKGDMHAGWTDLMSGRTTASNSWASLKCANVCYQISHFSRASLPSNATLLQGHNSYQQLINQIATLKNAISELIRIVLNYFSSFLLKLYKIIFKSVLFFFLRYQSQVLQLSFQTTK